MAHGGRKDHDHLFKLACSAPEAALAVVRAGLSERVAALIDPASLRLEPVSFVAGEPLTEDERDLVLSCRLGGRSALVYVLIEHQRTVDPGMPLRIAAYVERMWEWWRLQHAGEALPMVLPVVVHQGPGPWTGPRSIAEMLDADPDALAEVEPFMPGLRLALLDLGSLAPAAVAAFSAPAFLRLSLTLMRVVVIPEVRPEEVLRVIRVDLAGALQELLAQPGGDERLRKAVSYTVRRVQGLQVEAVRDATREAAGTQAGEVVMSTAQELMEQGARKLLVRQLIKKFKTLPEDVQERVAEASETDLEAWGDRVLSAKRLADVFSAPRDGKGKKPGSGKHKR